MLRCCSSSVRREAKEKVARESRSYIVEHILFCPAGTTWLTCLAIIARKLCITSFCEHACRNGEFLNLPVFEFLCFLHSEPCSWQGGSWRMEPGLQILLPHPRPSISVLNSFVPQGLCAADCIHVFGDWVVLPSVLPVEPVMLRVHVSAIKLLSNGCPPCTICRAAGRLAGPDAQPASTTLT